MDRIAIQRILHRQYDSGGSAHARNLFNDDGVGDVVKARAALGLGQRHGGESQVGGLAKRFARKLPALIQFARQRLHFAFGEFAHRALQQLLFFAEIEIQS